MLELDGRAYYHAGDTDHALELDDVKSDVALVPIGGHFTMNAEEAAGLVRAMRPRLAVPMHYGFVIGAVPDAETFAKAADPVPVEVMTPVRPFERF